MITLKAERGNLASAKGDAITYCVFEDKKTFDSQIKALRKQFGSISPALDAGVFTGKLQEVFTLYPSEKKTKLILVGLGKQESLTLEKLRRVAASAAKQANSLKAKSLAILEPEIDPLASLDVEKTWDDVAAALTEGAALSLYKYSKYLTSKNNKKLSLKQISIVSEKRLQAARTGVTLAETLVKATWFARDLGNAPADEIYPETLAQQAKQAGRSNKFSVTVFDEKKIARLKMGGVLAVGKGSERPPRFIIMEHNAKKKSLPTVVLVGKGVTFDAGGISIKPAAGMGEMKTDMGGSAAVIAAMQAIAQLKLPLHVVGLVPSVENMLGGRAMKPGDIVTHLNGKTSEVDNTDAEGRLILADALSYAARYKPDLVIDLATLTGHVVLSLGHYATGMMGNDAAQAQMDKLKLAGEQSYERVWQLPMFEEYERLNKSDIADVKNSGGRPAGAITAAFFLKQFIGDYTWIHLDIAGTAILNESLDYVPKGASGVGVRLLVQFLRNWK